MTELSKELQALISATLYWFGDHRTCDRPACPSCALTNAIMRYQASLKPWSVDQEAFFIQGPSVCLYIQTGPNCQSNDDRKRIAQQLCNLLNQPQTMTDLEKAEKWLGLSPPNSNTI